MNPIIEKLQAPLLPADINQLSDLICDTVNAGAAISFMQPFTSEMGRDYWTTIVEPQLASSTNCLFVARQDGNIKGSVQLIVKLPPNQPHRSEIAKLMVHPGRRRLGVGRSLMNAAIDEASAIGKKLVTLDTRTGDSAESLYSKVGFECAGVIPDFAFDPDGKSHHGATIMFKRL